MSTDCKEKLIRSLENSLIEKVDTSTVQLVVSQIIRVLNDYEVTEYCKDIVVYDNENERIMKRYCACLMVDGKSKNTIYQYRRTAEKLSNFIGKSFKQMGVYDIRYYLACEKERGVSDRSCENIRANLSAFFQWMTTEEIIPKNPCMNIKPLKYKDEIRKPFSEVEIDKLRSACDNYKKRAIVEFLLTSGVRVSELSSMRISDIDDINVHVRYGKGGKERITFINDVAKTHLQKYLLSRPEQGVALFYNKNHTSLSPGGIRSILKTIEKDSGVNNVHPHRFRRTFASGMARRGMDIQEIQKLLGHSNINTTMEYIYVDNSKIKNSYKQYIV